MCTPGSPLAAPYPAPISPAKTLTGEDEKPERCLQTGVQHDGLRGLRAKCCWKNKVGHSTVSGGGVPGPPCSRGVPKPWAPFCTSETSHLFPCPSLSLLVGWLFSPHAGSVAKSSPSGEEGFSWRLQQLCQLLLMSAGNATPGAAQPGLSPSLCSAACLFPLSFCFPQSQRDQTC